MINDIAEYIKQINLLYQTGKARELSYRSALEQLVKNCTGLKVIGEQARSEFGTPDFALTTKKNITVAYIETKDIANGDLDGLKKNKAQFDKYKAAVDTIVFTDYLDFHLYKDGSLVLQAELAVIKDDKIVLNEEALGAFKSIMDKLRYSAPQKISSPSKLAQLMADKAKLIADAILTDLKQDKEKKDKLWGQLVSFRKVLNKGLKENEFADLYAQTIAYGLFAARIHDNSKKEFTRLRAAECIPQTNPFLRDIFQQLAGFDISKSIVDIVDDLVDIFAATDVDRLRKNISKESLKHDPMIHFYEEFLEQYNPEARKKYGVYYTPQPVVEFIVRAVDDILKSDFGIEDGLADISKVDVEVQKPDLLQCQAFRRGLGPCQAAVLCLQNLLHVLRRPETGAHPQQCSHNDPHHVVQKTGGTDAQRDLLPLLPHVDLGDRADGVVLIAVGGTEALEIVLPF